MQGTIKKLNLNQETLAKLTTEPNAGLRVAEVMLSGGTWCQLCTQGA